MKQNRSEEMKMWRSKTFKLACALLLSVGLVASAYGQATTGTISGQVTDSSGAVIPGATVQAVNVETNVARTTKTDSSGAYVFPFLPPSTYKILVKEGGFKEITKNGVLLHIQERIAQNFQLTIGSVSESVEVTAGTQLMQTESASTGQVIDNKTIETLPLNGRDFTQLVTLAAGAVPNVHSRATNGFSLNGEQTFQTTMLVNGLNNTNYILGADTSNVNALTPSPDAVQEFNVQTGDYAAEYGRSSGGVVSVVIKSGTDHFHGTAFDFLRNDKLDANDYFANRSGLARPPLRRNQFGGTLGGPLLRNRFFFFASYQGTRQSNSTSGVVTVPTLDQYQAIQNDQPVPFATNIYNPFDVVGGVRQQFTQNTIPTNVIDPVGLKVATLYPKPNLSGTINNYGYNQSHTDNADEIDSRFDGQLRAKDNAFVTYSRGIATINVSPIFASPGNGGNYSLFPGREPIRAWNLGLGETHTFSSVVNDMRAGYTHNESNTLPPENSPLFQQFGIQGVPTLAGLNGLPSFLPSVYSGLGDRTYEPNPKLVQITQGTDTVSWLHGKHDVKFGGEMMFIHNYAGTSNSARGSFAFNGQFTTQVPGNKTGGSDLADLLLGQSDSATLSTPTVGRIRSRYFGLFIQDTWKVTTAFTVEVGLRYDLQTPEWERDNQMSNFEIFPGSANYGTLVDAKPGSFLDRTFSNLDTLAFAPRLGLIYQLDKKTVVRAGGGIFNGGMGFQAVSNMASANPPFSVLVSVPTAINAATSLLVLSNGFPPGLLSPTNIQNPTIYSFSANWPMPKVYQWNLSVQREIAADSSLNISYVGSSNSDLVTSDNLNAPPPGPGSLNPRRPFPTYGAILAQSPVGHSSYEGLQVTYEWRYHKGLYVLSNYTWSKSMDDVLTSEDGIGGGVNGPQIPGDFDAEKSLSGFDVPHRFVTTVMYQLPFGKAGSLLGSSAVERAVVGGWELGGIWQAMHGSPLTPGVSTDPANNGTPARPNRLCNGNLPRGSGTVNKWFNPACFAPAALYTFGNSGRDVIFAPGLNNLDLLLDRTFNFKESKSLEFRGEFFNLANSAHFGSPNATIGASTAGTITTDEWPNREVEVALRLRF